jgi:single-stranded DNA-specific DHH superfamily exonuclease
LQKINTATELLEENSNTIELHKKYNKLMEYVEKIVKKAKTFDNKLVLLIYSGENSLSSEISNYMYLHNKNKFVVVAFRKPDVFNVSIRGKNAKKILAKSIAKIEGASGGGHDEACGARIPADNFEEFKENIIKELNAKA